MSLQIGIVGLPNVGKSTLFNALTRTRNAHAENFPFCTIDPNVGMVEVPDKRLEKLAELVKPEKVIPTVVEFVDIAGLVKGASQGEGLGNQFLAHIRECDAVAQIVRIFEDSNVAHVDGALDPKRDLETILTELVIADLETVKKRRDKIEKPAKTGNKEKMKELEIVLKLEKALDSGKMALHVELSDEDRELIKDLFLLTKKPYIYVANISETQLDNFDIDETKSKINLKQEDILVPISAKLEADLIEFSPEEQKEYLEELGLKATGMDRFIRAAYKTLGLITFFTAGPKEARAWTVKKGATAPEAAGVIHTDFQKGFICAETIAYEDYAKVGTEAAAKEQGLMKTNGKEYIVEDGDVFYFRFNV